MTENEGNVAIALSLVVMAGASTSIGAAVVFFPSIVKIASQRVLAGSLGFSAGVMTYISFIEIFQKSRGSFEEAGFDEGKAYSLATLCFFGGVLVMILMNYFVSWLLGGDHHHHHDHDQNHAMADDTATTVGPPCCSNDVVENYSKIQEMASELEHEQLKSTNSDMNEDSDDEFVDNLPVPYDSDDDDDDDVNQNNGADIENGNKKKKKKRKSSSTNNNNNNSNNTDDTSTPDAAKQKKLIQMGANTAIAIGLHNFPEGLATFVAALSDARVGAVLAFAIAIHNIPEGLCVALPIYYATGNRLKGFLWALLSGASEFVAALLGWAILANSFSHQLYAVLFGMVAGMMVIISIRELLPTAHFYDPDDTVVTHSFIGGMIVISLSLVLFIL